MSKKTRRRCAKAIAHPPDLDAHAAGGARDRLHRLVEVARVEVLQLEPGDLAKLVLADAADLAVVGVSTSKRGIQRQLGSHSQSITPVGLN
jgi:hypothetical protein